MLRAEEIWCQGYSEPGAGSDLASLKTRAVLRGDTYIVNGQKVWTSNAHLSDWNFCLVRTNPDVPKHSGIGFLLINMRTPGVEVRPIRQINGASGFSEVFYTDVEVPAENMVGAPDEGWRVANTLLGYERGSGTLTRSLNFARQLRELFALAKTQKRGGKALYDDPAWRQRLGQFAIDVEVLRLFGLRQLTTLARGEAHGPESSIQKLYWSELEQRLAIAGNEMLGPYAQLTHHSEAAVDEGRWSHRELTTRAVTIYSGTSEIQKNIIAERVLGLPRG
jgi:alkylation response protein AidB-like acyl-CoA dehydrogenase